MKTSKSIALICLFVFTMSACSTSMNFLTSSIVPAASGSIRTSKDKNDNYTLSVDVRNLAEPKNLTPAKEAYIVWMEDGRNAVKKLGQIIPSSKSLKGSLSATSVTEPTRIFITAEDGIERQNPEGQIILTTK